MRIGTVEPLARRVAGDVESRAVGQPDVEDDGLDPADLGRPARARSGHPSRAPRRAAPPRAGAGGGGRVAGRPRRRAGAWPNATRPPGRARPTSTGRAVPSSLRDDRHVRCGPEGEPAALSLAGWPWPPPFATPATDLDLDGAAGRDVGSRRGRLAVVGRRAVRPIWIVWPEASLSVSWSARDLGHLAADRDPAAGAPPKKPPGCRPWPPFRLAAVAGLTAGRCRRTGAGTRPPPVATVAGRGGHPTHREADAADGEDRRDDEDDVDDARASGSGELRGGDRADRGLTGGRLDRSEATGVRPWRLGARGLARAPGAGAGAGGARGRPGRRRARSDRWVRSSDASPTRSEGRRWGRDGRPAARATRRRSRRRRG